eukprot:TRINITY_DN5782_c0_g2_i3.p1 TRINITY_DN5782_c0_g2~~TRINITY_DN5782_c0_g2_i3.p1  ORF type:complete len:684 (+),score=126.48 TRINITY_DN5782_c0_g2_i3:405-2456(+)
MTLLQLGAVKIVPSDFFSQCNLILQDLDLDRDFQDPQHAEHKIAKLPVQMTHRNMNPNKQQLTASEVNYHEGRDPKRQKTEGLNVQAEKVSTTVDRDQMGSHPDTAAPPAGSRSSKPLVKRSSRSEKLIFPLEKVYTPQEEFSFEELRMRSWAPRPKQSQGHTKSKLLLSPSDDMPSGSLSPTQGQHLHASVREKQSPTSQAHSEIRPAHATQGATTGLYLNQSQQPGKHLQSEPHLHNLPPGTFTVKAPKIKQDGEHATNKSAVEHRPEPRVLAAESDSETVAPDSVETRNEGPKVPGNSPPILPEISKDQEVIDVQQIKVQLVQAFADGERRKMFEHARKWLESPPGRAAGYLVHDHDEGHVLKKTMEGSSAVQIAGQKYQGFKVLGSGGFANVYSATRLTDGSNMAIKVQKPGCPWEFYISNMIVNRVPKSMTKCYLRARQIECYPSGSILVMDQGSYGTLQDLINMHLAKDSGIEENVVIAYSIEILRIVRHLHSANILHADIKPDNFLLRKTSSIPKDADIFGLLDSRGLQLIDYGQSIDLSLYPGNVQFIGKVATDHFQCIEMQTKKPWKFQNDFYTIAATTHSLLFGKYMEVTQLQGRWQIRQKLKRYWNRDIWDVYFGTLLNPTHPMENVLASLEDFLVNFTKEPDTKVDEIAKSMTRMDSSMTDYLRKKKAKAK